MNTLIKSDHDYSLALTLRRGGGLGPGAGRVMYGVRLALPDGGVIFQRDAVSPHGRRLLRRLKLILASDVPYYQAPDIINDFLDDFLRAHPPL
jgi:hypothetical protein